MGELLIILAIFVLLFGARRLPALADGMGKAIRNFKKGLNTDEDVTPPPPAAPSQTGTTKQVSEFSGATEVGTPASETHGVKRTEHS
jgi:sec-independent protein translocase protein TatA